MNATVKVWDPLAGLHVAGVVLASIRHRESLVKSMRHRTQACVG